MMCVLYDVPVRGHHVQHRRALTTCDVTQARVQGGHSNNHELTQGITIRMRSSTARRGAATAACSTDTSKKRHGSSGSHTSGRRHRQKRRLKAAKADGADLASILKLAGGALAQASDVLSQPKEDPDELDRIIAKYSHSRKQFHEESNSVVASEQESEPHGDTSGAHALEALEKEILAEQKALDKYEKRVARRLEKQGGPTVTPLPAHLAHLVPETEELAQVDDQQVSELLERFAAVTSSWVNPVEPERTKRARKTASVYGKSQDRTRQHRRSSSQDRPNRLRKKQPNRGRTKLQKLPARTRNTLRARPASSPPSNRSRRRRLARNGRAQNNKSRAAPRTMSESISSQQHVSEISQHSFINYRSGSVSQLVTSRKTSRRKKPRIDRGPLK